MDWSVAWIGLSHELLQTATRRPWLALCELLPGCSFISGFQRGSNTACSPFPDRAAGSAAEPRESFRVCPCAMQRKRSAEEAVGASSSAASSAPSVLRGSSAWWWRQEVSSDESDASSGPDLSGNWLKQDLPPGPATYAEVADIVPNIYGQLVSAKGTDLQSQGAAGHPHDLELLWHGLPRASCLTADVCSRRLEACQRVH